MFLLKLSLRLTKHAALLNQWMRFAGVKSATIEHHLCKKGDDAGGCMCNILLVNHQDLLLLQDPLLFSCN